MPITAASDVEANELDRGDYIELLAEGTGLPSEQVDATKTAWAPTAASKARGDASGWVPPGGRNDL